MQRLRWPSFHQDILEKTRTLCVGGGGISSFFSRELGHLTSWGFQLDQVDSTYHQPGASYKLGRPTWSSWLNIPTTSLKKKLDISWGGGSAFFFVASFRGPYHSSSKLAILSSRHLGEDKLAILSSRHLGEDSVLKKKNLVCWWGWDIKFFFRRVGGLTSWDVQVCSTYQPPPWKKTW